MTFTFRGLTSLHGLLNLIDLFFLFRLPKIANAIRVKRQEENKDKKEETFEQELCKDKDAGEWFRLVANDGDSCRDVIQCTTSVSCLKTKTTLIKLI